MSSKAITTKWFKTWFSIAKTGGTSLGSRKSVHYSSSAKEYYQTSTFKSISKSLSFINWFSSQLPATSCHVPNTNSINNWKHLPSAATSTSFFSVKYLSRSSHKRLCIRMSGLISFLKYSKTILNLMMRSLNLKKIAWQNKGNQCWVKNSSSEVLCSFLGKWSTDTCATTTWWSSRVSQPSQKSLTWSPSYVRRICTAVILNWPIYIKFTRISYSKNCNYACKRLMKRTNRRIWMIL